MKPANFNIYWPIENLGYEPQTTFWQDFSIADRFGEEAIVETYHRVMKEWKNNYVYLTELVMVLNWKIWQFYDTDRDDLAKIYDALWRMADEYAVENLKGEELQYFYRTTD